MAASLSSDSHSTVRDHSHEQTPLLGANAAANEASLANGSSRYQQQERSEERAHNDLEHPNNEEEQDRGGDSELTREDENKANPKTSVGIMGVISVLLLGSWVFFHREDFHREDGRRYLLSYRVLFTK